ncbi:PREDICTED: serine protease SP24D-like [Rhagoletis zephyria]|uniref:serine protease SP24D-like n=1 Tax=Rhagoletis zephyria TaxID=28612 RepID=UPI000811864F|nr:PREDICTED: serine protease SP24D-like [Rhagoletis zephyria]
MAYPNYFPKLLILICMGISVIQAGSISSSIVKGSLLPSPRILNARVAGSGQFPYQVSVRVGGQHNCGGVIISQIYVLTAAHCVYSFRTSQLTVQAGSINRTEGGVVAGVSKITPHEEFYFYNNDIALLKLNISLEYSDLIQPIPLAAILPPAGVQVTVSGWGRIREAGPLSDTLLYARNLFVLKTEDCSKFVGSSTLQILCLQKVLGNGICDGDDGGPAVYQGFLIGIASYNSNGCGNNNPDGFTKIPYFKRWIVENSDLDSEIAG